MSKSISEIQEELRVELIKGTGNEIARCVADNHAQCPTCGKIYKFSKPIGLGAPWEKEQHIGGFCSDECWPY